MEYVPELEGTLWTNSAGMWLYSSRKNHWKRIAPAGDYGAGFPALNWAATMTWRGIRPIIQRIAGEYERGVRIARTAFRAIADRLNRSETLPKWSLTITPESR